MQKKLKIGLSSVFALMIFISCGLGALAAPSITGLHENKEQTVIQSASTDGTNTASILSETGIYTNEAVSDQYKQQDETGNLESTPLSNMIDLGAGTITEVNQNGNAIPDAISSVKDMLDSYCAEANVDEPQNENVELSDLDQLTYWLDFKYETTNYRVIAEEKISKNDTETKLDNGMIVAEIDGGEIIRASEINQYLIIQIDAVSGEIHYLTMKDYDPVTGKYTVEFPCLGPYLITQIMQ